MFLQASPNGSPAPHSVALSSSRMKALVRPAADPVSGGAAKGYIDVPQVECVVAVHLCLHNTSTWRNHPCLPSKACKLSSARDAKAYSAAGQTASTLHAMAILQVNWAKALKKLNEGSSDQGLMQELCMVIDFALQAIKLTARSLRQVMSTMVVQERHLWWNLDEMQDADKVFFLDAPVSQDSFFSDTVENFAHQISALMASFLWLGYVRLSSSSKFTIW